jgi:hypothetical protein
VVAVTLLSNFDGAPYSLMPAPGAFIHGGVSGGSAASAARGATAAMPTAPTAAALRVRKLRRVTGDGVA